MGDGIHSAFPEATWVAIGLPRMPDDQGAWVAQGLNLELDEALTTRGLPRQVPKSQGVCGAPLRGDDWAQSVARRVVENDRTGEQDPGSLERFAQGQVRTRPAFAQRERGASFGAFADGVLVADLGIVRCGTTARYQSVGTDEEHRRRGLASHLLGVAARWSADRGCDRWVIVTEATKPAGRVYRKRRVRTRDRQRPGVPRTSALSRDHP